MNRQAFLDQLRRYSAFDPDERRMAARMLTFVSDNERCFQRGLEVGHITASCWVVDPARTQTLLTWHRRLDRWLQMGGHIEDDASLIEAAARELREESGLERFEVASTQIFDLDVHLIPARKQEPEHFHYDVRFLFTADPAEELRISSESRELAWVPLEKVLDLNPDASMRRMIAKIRGAAPTV